MSARIVDMTGKKYGNATAIESMGRNESRGFIWKFLCDCEIEFEASGSEVRYGRISSCPDCSAKRQAEAKTTHGLTGHPIYGIWGAMKTRCSNPNFHAFKDYGGRGISVCARWNSSFAAFLEDMDDRPSPMHTIERSDVNGNYEPGNCHWATRREQGNNKRNNRKICINGETKNLAEWAAHSGVGESLIRQRLKKGLDGTSLISKATT